MTDWNRKKDIRITADGDFMFQGGDFAMVRNEDCAAQLAYIYLNTPIRSHPLWPSLGEDVQDLFGETIDDSIEDRVRERIEDCLTRFGRIPHDALMIETSKLGDSGVSAEVYIKTQAGWVSYLPKLRFTSAGVFRET